MSKLNIKCILSSVTLDVGSWREGGGRNLNTASSPPEMDNRPQEENSAGLGNSTPPGEADEKSKREGKDRVPPSGPSQPKLNGSQQPAAGMPTNFDPAFRSMMPPYVSRRFTSRLCPVLILNDVSLCFSFRCSMPTLICLLYQDKEISDTPYHKMEQSEFPEVQHTLEYSLNVM